MCPGLRVWGTPQPWAREATGTQGCCVDTEVVLRGVTVSLTSQQQKIQVSRISASALGETKETCLGQGAVHPGGDRARPGL